MYIDINNDHFNDDLLSNLKQSSQLKQGIYSVDPMQQANTSIDSNTTGTTGNVYVGNNTFDSNLWNQLNRQSLNTYPIFSDPDPVSDLTVRIDKLELDNKLLRLKLLSLEGKFTQEEVANIRKMLMAEDESSRTLADSIIENA